MLSRSCLYLGLGLAFGLTGAWNLVRFVEAFLFQIGPRDVTVYAMAALIVIAARLCATVVPARRAASVDPLVTLKPQ